MGNSEVSSTWGTKSSQIVATLPNWFSIFCKYNRKISQGGNWVEMETSDQIPVVSEDGEFNRVGGGEGSLKSEISSG